MKPVVKGVYRLARRHSFDPVAHGAGSCDPRALDWHFHLGQSVDAIGFAHSLATHS